MDESQLRELDIPEKCFPEAQKLLAKIEAVNPNRTPPHHPDEIIGMVGADPIYVVMEGGSDGTWGHNEFLGMYGDLKPEIIELAALVAGASGLEW